MFCFQFLSSTCKEIMDKVHGALKEGESKFGIKLKDFQQTLYAKIFTGKDVFYVRLLAVGKPFASYFCQS